jgi:methionyl aminopeptidase
LQGQHKILHKIAQGKTQNDIFHNGIDSVTGTYNPFPTHSFTGPVQPLYPLSPMRTVPESIRHPDWAKDGKPKAERRLSRSKIDLLDAKGQAAMRRVCSLAREVLDVTAAEVRPGVTTDYLDEVCHKACVERNVSTTLCLGVVQSL